MRVKGRVGVFAGQAEIYVAFLSGKTTGCCEHDAHLQSENSLKMSLPIAPAATVDHRVGVRGADLPHDDDRYK